MGDTQEREWTRWSDQRPPNERGSYRYRATFPFLGLTVTAEWTEEMRLCGMGYGDSEWWPITPCHWNGYSRYITNPTLEWSSVQAYDDDGIVWHGLDLLPCPFTGKRPKLEAQGSYIGAPLWRSEAVWISSPGVPKRRWTDAKAMQKSWNTRAPAASPTLLEALIRAADEIEDLRKYANNHGGMIDNERCDYARAAITLAIGKDA